MMVGGGGREWHGAVLASLAEAADVSAVAGGDVTVVEPDEFGDPETSLGGEREQGSVSSSFPAVLVRGGKHSVELVLGEEGDLGAVEPFGWNGQHAADQLGVFGMGERRVGEQGPDRGEPQIPCPGGVLTLRFEMVEERSDRVGVEIGPVEPVGLDPLGVVDPGDEQSERVPIRGDSAGTGLALPHEPVGEEALQCRGDEAHGSTSSGSSRRAASASSSGAADRYQYVDLGSRWPR